MSSMQSWSSNWCKAVLLVLALCICVQPTSSWQHSSTAAASVSTATNRWAHKHHGMKMHFDEAIQGNSQLKSTSLPANRYLATNRFNVRPKAMARFEKRWADRKSRLALLPGFRFFTLLRRVSEFGVEYDDDLGNYVSFTFWEDKPSFDAWRTGEAFKEAHGKGGIMDFIGLLTTALFIIKGSPKPAFYDALLFKAASNEQIANLLPFTKAAENGWRAVAADGENLLNPEIFLVQNRFKVTEGKELDFEKVWAERESRLSEEEGFLCFSMIRRDATKADDGFNYISTTLWRGKEDFMRWRNSDSFKLSHKAAGDSTAPKLYDESPKLAFYEGKLTLVGPNGI